MKKNFLLASILMTLMALLSAHVSFANAPSNWVVLKKNDLDLTIYYDSTSIKTDENQSQLRQVHILMEPKENTTNRKAKPVQANSILIITTINCNNKTGRIDEIRFYNLPKAQGEPVHINANPNDQFSSFNSNDEGDVQMLAAVCQ